MPPYSLLAENTYNETTINGEDLVLREKIKIIKNH